jgi:Protein of unknown function (DUF3300)
MRRVEGQVTQSNRPFSRKVFGRFAVRIFLLSFVLGAKSRAQTASPPAAQSAPVDTSPAALDHLLAPIALYPDALLMQVLAASLNSQEVLDGGNWLLEHKSLEGTQLDSAAKAAGFGAAMTALFRFPDVVDLMCTQLDWTRQLGAAFNADQAGVLASVQRLRAKAQQYGTLKSTPQQTVATQQDNGKQVIVIQPTNPQVIYVPQYNPQTVYVSSGPSTSTVVATSIISFGLGVAVGALFSSNHYYYPRWGYGGVWYGGRPWYPTHYVYRPVYTSVWRPAYGYRPPPNYPPRVAHYNYNNYYNSFRPPSGGSGYRPPTNGGYNRPTTLPANSGGYNKPATGGYNKPSTLPATRPPGGNYNGNGATRPNNTYARPAVPPDRGYAKPAAQPAPQTRPATTSRPAPSQTRQAPAFQAGNSGSTERAASQRGAASAAGRKPQ